uniref:receptor protein serine/threonine kinase n=2 Tax=Mesocestoides corti TaxID=53468 RepID=A0A5K3FR97_MESCO
MFIRSSNITCYCFPPEKCNSTTHNRDACVTSTGCFTVKNRVGGFEHTISGCFSSDVFQMRLTCAVTSDIDTSIFCCDDSDFCNRPHSTDRLLQPPTPPSNYFPLSSVPALNLTRTPPLFQNAASVHPTSDARIDHVLIFVIACIALLSVVIIFLLLCVCLNRKDYSKYRCACHRSDLDNDAQCSDCKRNLGIIISKTNMYSHGNTLLTSLRCPCLFSCYGKMCPDSASHLSQVEALKKASVTRHILSLPHSSSTDQRPMGSAVIEPPRNQFAGTLSSGSGSGVPFLVQATVAREISLQECIGKGRFGEVWRGVYRGENVAVKIFSSRDEASWARETHIYSSILLRHENILGYYASDITSRYGCTQLWIISHYHPYGSLYDFLQAHVVDTIAALRLAKTAAAGLCYLHSCILGLQGKPAIAHRDIKSKNILVQANGICSIGDLGLAIMQTPGSTELDIGRPNHKVGTKRYMAPEILANDNLEESSESGEGILPHDLEVSAFLHGKNRVTGSPPLSCTLGFDFEELKAADVYAFGLVLWEIFRRCITEKGEVYPARVPYWDKVSANPSFAEMREVVHAKGERPPISKRWQTSKLLARCGRLMQECWHPVPEVRLPILRVKKTLDDAFHVAVNEVDDGAVLSPVAVVSDIRSQVDSGLSSRSNGGPFQFSPNIHYYQTQKNANIRSPREVLALGRIIRWPSEINLTEDPSESKILIKCESGSKSHSELSYSSTKNEQYLINDGQPCVKLPLSLPNSPATKLHLESLNRQKS